MLFAAVMITAILATVLCFALWRLSAAPTRIAVVIGAIGTVVLALPPLYVSLQPAAAPPAAPAPAHSTSAVPAPSSTASASS
ncbi:hypothetical protein P8605_34385, partial [Streptomyces sp. T-3]|nr:hypothetical protein [Streptomyces sp. T-3]